MTVPLHRSRNLSSVLWWSLAIAVAVMSSAVLGAIAALMVPSSPLVRSARPSRHLSRAFGYELTRPVNLMVLGVDRDLDVAPDSPRRFEGRSDTVLAVRFDPARDRLYLLSVPRDTRVALPNLGETSLNRANALGGVELAQASLSALLNNLEFDRYLRVRSDALVELVDMLGGVEVFVPVPMSYRDRTQQLEIELDAGWQLLDGEQAQQFSRYRQGAYGDIGRVQRQQMLLSALRDRLTHPTVLTRVPAIVRALNPSIDTNLNTPELLALAHFALQLDPEDLQMALLPGRFGTADNATMGAWLVDEPARDRLVRDFFARTDRPNFIDRPGDRTPVAPTATATTANLRIALQNATADPEAVERTRAHLAERGYTNVYVSDDWHETRRQSAIVVQNGDYDAARQLQSAIGFGEIEPRSTGDLDSDLTLRIGQDVTQLY